MPEPCAASSSCASRRESGGAIILALLTLAVVSALAAVVITQLGAAVAAVAGRHDQAQARALARGAIDWGRNILAEDARTTRTDHPGESWAIRIPPTPVEDGEVSGELQDLSGRFDLNSLVRGGSLDDAQLAAYRRLLAVLGIPAAQADSLAASLVDWMRAAANAPLVDVDELRLVRGYTDDVMERLRPYAAALPASSALNVNTASAEVLHAQLPGLGLDTARILVAQRESSPFRDLSDFVSRLPASMTKPDTTRLAVTSRYFLASGRSRYGDATTRLQVMLDRQRGWPDIVWQKIL